MSNILALGGMLTSVYGVIVGAQSYKSIQAEKNKEV